MPAGTSAGFGWDGMPHMDWREWKDHSRRMREMEDAVRAQAAGRSRKEVTELLVAEMRRRDLQVPPEPFLEVLVDDVMAPADPFQRLQANVEVVTSLVRGGVRLVRFLREHTSDSPGGGPADDDAGEWSMRGGEGSNEYFGSLPWMDGPTWTIAVDVDEAGRKHLARAAAKEWLRLAGFTTLEVTLRRTGQPDSGRIAVDVDGETIGAIPPADAAPFWSALQSENGQRSDLFATRRRSRRRAGGHGKGDGARSPFSRWPSDAARLQTRAAVRPRIGA